jgi:hypothetical protein
MYDRGRPVRLQEAAYRPKLIPEHCVGSQVIPGIRGAIKTGRASYSCVLTAHDSASLRDRSRVIGSALINQSHTLRLASYSKSPKSLYSGASAAIKVLFCGAEK